MIANMTAIIMRNVIGSCPPAFGAGLSCANNENALNITSADTNLAFMKNPFWPGKPDNDVTLFLLNLKNFCHTIITNFRPIIYVSLAQKVNARKSLYL